MTFSAGGPRAVPQRALRSGSTCRRPPRRAPPPQIQYFAVLPKRTPGGAAAGRARPGCGAPGRQRPGLVCIKIRAGRIGPTSGSARVTVTLLRVAWAGVRPRSSESRRPRDAKLEPGFARSSESRARDRRFFNRGWARGRAAIGIMTAAVALGRAGFAKAAD